MKLANSNVKLDSTSRLISMSILLAGMTLTSVLVSYVHTRNASEEKMRLEYESNFIIRRIQTWMERYEGALIQSRAFILNSTPISRQNYKEYIADTEIFKRYPGLQGIGYTTLIPATELKEHIKQLKQEIPNYKVWPEAKHDIYSSIITIEPSNKRNLKAIGYDMYNEPIRRKAMDMAIDLNKAIRTVRVTLVQEDHNKNLPGFNLYLPIYKKRSDSSQLEGRRKNVIGFVYSPFRAKELFSAILKTQEMVLDVEIYDGIEIRPDKLIFDFDKTKDTTSDSNHLKLEINLYGEPLSLIFSPLANFTQTDSNYKTIGVFILGTLLTFGILWFYNATKKRLILARQRAIKKSLQLTREKFHVEVRDDFLSIASHELKTPLTSLKLQAQLLMRQISKDNATEVPKEKFMVLMNHINTQTSRLTRLVDDMLDISRIRTGNLKIEKSDVDLKIIISEVVERLSSQFTQHTGQVPEIECQGSTIGHWDQFRLEQVLTNLLTNALRYGDKKPVKIRCTKEESFVKLEIIDQGIGIAPENIDRIFDRFQRAEMSDKEVNGLGLGLFITNQIVLAHNGRIEVHSELGKGSTFAVILPLS